IQVPQDGYWGDMPTRLTGAVGGHMVRRMIALAEQQLAQQGTLPPVSPQNQTR
ncbi:MAG TPA: alpha/beta-type small acid-soluble spore protein, partial [Thermaerobacter sp.]